MSVWYTTAESGGGAKYVFGGIAEDAVIEEKNLLIDKKNAEIEELKRQLKQQYDGKNI